MDLTRFSGQLISFRERSPKWEEKDHIQTAFRQQMVALVRSGRSANDLAKEFEPTAQTISAWVRQADRDEGRRDDGLTVVSG